MRKNIEDLELDAHSLYHYPLIYPSDLLGWHESRLVGLDPFDQGVRLATKAFFVAFDGAVGGREFGIESEHVGQIGGTWKAKTGIDINGNGIEDHGFAND